jgi:tRNA(adenine34) deaminase
MSLNLATAEADIYFMKMAMQQAQAAYQAGEVPVGAILVIDNKIISKAHNQVQLLSDPTAHAEVLAITSACNHLQSKYLPTATLYVTLEPCLMCSGALYWSQIGTIVFGAADAKNGYRKICQHQSPFHPKTIIREGVMALEGSTIMSNFFSSKR